MPPTWIDEYHGLDAEHAVRAGLAKRVITAEILLPEVQKRWLGASSATALAREMEQAWQVVTSKATINRHASSGKHLNGCINIQIVYEAT